MTFFPQLIIGGALHPLSHGSVICNMSLCNLLLCLLFQGPGPNARIVYIDGAFDLFHAGHVEVLLHIYIYVAYSLKVYLKFSIKKTVYLKIFQMLFLFHLC